VAAIGWQRFFPDWAYDRHFTADVQYARHLQSIDEGRKDFKRVNGKWSFDEESFVKACDVISENTRWKYGGGTELLLFEAQKGERKSAGFKTRDTSESVYADFSTAVTVHLDTLMQKKPTETPQIIFKRVFRYAKQYEGNNPLMGLSLQEARVSAFAAIVQTVIGYLPKEVKEQIEYAKEFGVKNISKQSDRQLKVTHKQHSWSL
jgi:hypothetical protein